MLAYLLLLAQAAAAPPPTCAGPEHRQFDFWIGEWTVTQTGKADVVANSLIERLYGGCAVRENWMPLKGAGGGSLNNYVAEDGRWHQTWVDSSNSRVEFSGGAGRREDGAHRLLEGRQRAGQGRADPYDLFKKC